MKYALLFALFTAAVLPAADTDPRDGYVQVSLERREGSDWKPVDPRTVLNPADKIRFKFESTYSGYLYVYD